MKFSLNLLAVLAIPLVAAHGGKRAHKRGIVGQSQVLPAIDRRANSAALNPTLTNTIPNLSGPVLYYNGSGDVPSENTYSPDPVPSPRKLSPVPLYKTPSINLSFKSRMERISLLVVDNVMSPNMTMELLIDVCNANENSFYNILYAPTCREEFSGLGNTGPYWASLFSALNASTGDMQAICALNFDICSVPPVIKIDESKYFSPKPANASVVPAPSGEVIEVIHLSDWHLDPRYDIGSESNCSQYLCCRDSATNTKLKTNSNNASVPASRFGSLYCDSPPDLALSAFQVMPQFFNVSQIAFSIFTGDIVSHDDDNQLSRAYIEYEETVTYQTFKAQMGDIPIYPTLGNHDSLPEADNPQNSYYAGGNGSTNALSWNYDLLSQLWQNNSWLDPAAYQYAKTHYGAYSLVTPLGLRVISINTDFWYTDNIFNALNFSNPDQSGILTFLAKELTAAEAAGQRAWIIGHVLSGYDGTNGLPNPTALFYSIVARFSPTTIAGIFFGHTHEEQKMIYYDYNPTSLNGTIRNTTDVNFNAPLNVGWIGPSITPLTGNNAGFVRYQVDGKTFSVIDSQTYIANVSESLTWSTPQWKYEYDARTTYGSTLNWPADAPLNATFWNDVTNVMLNQTTPSPLLNTYALYETKSSVTTKNCTSAACQAQKVCFIRSGSSALSARCGKEISGAF